MVEDFLRAVRRQREAERSRGMSVVESDGVWYVNRSAEHIGGPFANNVEAWRWLDRKAGTEGIFTIVGALVGFGATLYFLIRDLSRQGRKDQ
jgi:F0F1-type ATP synthase assembly protein I